MVRARSITLFIAAASLAAAAVTRSGGAGRAQTTGWIAKASMPLARTGFAGVAGPAGKIYVFGGTDFVQNFSNAEVYDPAANTWSEIAPLPRAVSFMAAAFGYDSRIYVIGGTDGHQPVNWVQAYDPRSNTWACSFAAVGCAFSTLTPLPTARAGLAAVPVGDGHVIFAMGGFTTQPVATDEVYSPKFNVWFPGSPLRRPASGLSAGVIRAPLPAAAGLRAQTAPSANGAIVAFGGTDGKAFNNQFESKPIAEQRDPTPPEDIPFPDLGEDPFPIDFPEPPLPFPDFPDPDPFDDLPDPPPLPDPFDPVASDPLWNEPAVFDPEPPPSTQYAAGRRLRAQQTTLPPYGAVYVIGNETGASDPVHVFDASAHAWSAGPQLHTARVNSLAVVTSDRMLYVIGGNDAFNHVYNLVDALPLRPLPLRPTSTSTPTPTPTPMPTPTSIPTSTPTVVPSPTPVPTATKPPVKKTCPKNAGRKRGKCVCKKGYVMKKGKCVKKPKRTEVTP